MKIQTLLPLVMLLAAVLGCSRITEVANRSGEAGNTANTNASETQTAESGPAPAEFAPGGDAKADLEKLAERFMTIESFRAKMHGEGQTPMRTELEYVAPDRYRMKTGNGVDVVIIGRTTYMKVGAKWQKMNLPLDGAIDQMRTAFNKDAMKWVSDVRYTGDDSVNGKAAYVYTFHGKGPNNVGDNDSKLWVAKSDGRPVKVEAVYKSGALRSMTIEYDYDTPVSIEAPVS